MTAGSQSGSDYDVPASQPGPNATTSRRGESLDLLIAFRRAELDVVQARLDRSDTNAAGVISASVALGALAASTLAAVNRSMSTFAIVCTAVGGALVLIAMFGSFNARDSSDQHNPVGRILLALARPMRGFANELLALRGQMRYATLDATAETDADGIRLEISDMLEKRLTAATSLAKKLDSVTALLTFCLAAGAFILTLGIVAVLVVF